MKVYIAGSSSDVARADNWRRQLKTAGIEVVSTWTDSVKSVGEGNPRDVSNTQRWRWSTVCLTELRTCDLFWFLVPAQATRGAWLELGSAHAQCKTLVCSGDTKQSIFCALATEFATDDEAFDLIVQLKALHG